MDNIIIIDHPLIQHKISILRDKHTGSKEFRELIAEVSMLMCYEATRNLPLKEVEIETPISICKTKFILGRKLTFVPILRAGLSMVDALMNLIPTANIGHIGIYREASTLNPIKYYCKLPTDISKREVIILDPIIATAESACKAIQLVKNQGATNIKFMCILLSKLGVEKLSNNHPDIKIYCVALDNNVDDKGYISPGMGDIGDRAFGAK